MDCAVHNIATREIIDLMKNNVKNTDFQGENRVFVGIVSRLQYYTCCYIMNRTGRSRVGFVKVLLTALPKDTYGSNSQVLFLPNQNIEVLAVKLVFLDHPHHFFEFSPFFRICSIKHRKIDHFRNFEKSDACGKRSG